jgi:hypothetical protein
VIGGEGHVVDTEVRQHEFLPERTVCTAMGELYMGWLLSPLTMGKNRDLIQILTLVIIGMFIPFLGSLVITFNLNLLRIGDVLKIGSTFGYFLLIFGIELGVVYLYFTLTNRLAQKHLEKFKSKQGK